MRTNKKILIVTECFYPEEFKINDVAENWIKKGHEVDVLTLIPTYPAGKPLNGYKNSLYLKETINQINLIRVHAIVGYNDNKLVKILKYINFMFLGSIVALIIGRRYDHVFGYNLGALSDMLPAVIIRKIYKKPLTLWVQDLWPDSVYAYGFEKTKFLSYFLDMLVKFVYKNADNIALSSKGFQSHLLKYVGRNQKFHYIPNWSDELNMNLEPILYSQDKRIQFTFAGNIGKVQNIENIIIAFSSLPKYCLENAQLNIVGDGSNLSFVKSLCKSNMPIVFHGRIKRELISKYLMGSDFLIISLIDEPIFSKTVPAKLQTYIKAKKPILGVINGEAAQIIDEYKLGLCVEPSDTSLISQAFKKCIDMSEEARNDFIKNNQVLSETLFDRDIVLKKINDIIN